LPSGGLGPALGKRSRGELPLLAPDQPDAARAATAMSLSADRKAE
jgi:hypothetical protein